MAFCLCASRGCDSKFNKIKIDRRTDKRVSIAFAGFYILLKLFLHGYSFNSIAGRTHCNFLGNYIVAELFV